MTQTMPRFLDVPAPAAAADPPSAALDAPMLLEAEQDSRKAIGADWNPARIVRTTQRSGSVIYAAAGLGLILASWVGFSVLTSVIGFFQVSVGLGVAASLLCGAGIGFLGFATLREWRSLRRLRRVEALRSALADGSASAPGRQLCKAWLDDLGDHLPEAAAAAAGLPDAADMVQMRALLRGHLAEPLRAATRGIALRAATEASALVAISPHASWDGPIVAFRGLRVIRLVAQLYGLRPGPVVTVALLGRVARAAAETAAVDLVSQTAADHVLNNMPVLKHVGAIAGASTAAFRLYRLTHVAARACDPLGE